jgi:hypothetical protein
MGLVSLQEETPESIFSIHVQAATVGHREAVDIPSPAREHLPEISQHLDLGLTTSRAVRNKLPRFSHPQDSVLCGSSN